MDDGREIVAMLIAPGFMIAAEIKEEDEPFDLNEGIVVYNPLLYTERKEEQAAGGHKILPEFKPFVHSFLVEEMLVRPIAIIGKMPDTSKKFFDSAYTKALRSHRARHTGILVAQAKDVPHLKPVQ